MESALYQLFVVGALVVAASAASLEDPREARQADSAEKADAVVTAELTSEMCGPNGDPIGCILGAFLGDTQLARGYHRIGKKMILPLLVGILLKVASFVPLILGKLSLLAFLSIVASKMALVISAIVGTKRLYGAGHPYHSGHHDWEHAASEPHLSYAEYPHAAAAHSTAAFSHAHAAHAVHRRVAPNLTMGRSLQNADSWTPYRGHVNKSAEVVKQQQSRQQDDQSEQHSDNTTKPTEHSTASPPSTPSVRRRRHLD